MPQNQPLESVKLALRIKSAAYDAEIAALIAAGQASMSASGIGANNATDPLYQAALVAYCKAHFGLENEDGERWEKVFRNITEQMALCGQYNDRGGQ